jgi:hypothetical protein
MSTTVSGHIATNSHLDLHSQFSSSIIALAEMPRSQVAKSILQAGRLVLAESAVAESSLLNVAKAGRTFSSVAGRSILTRGGAVQIGQGVKSACKCSCGKFGCAGIHTSAAASAAQAQPVEEAPHAPSLTARCVDKR